MNSSLNASCWGAHAAYGFFGPVHRFAWRPLPDFRRARNLGLSRLLGHQDRMYHIQEELLIRPGWAVNHVRINPLFRERPNQTMVPAQPFRLLRPLEECVSPSEQTFALNHRPHPIPRRQQRRMQRRSCFAPLQAGGRRRRCSEGRRSACHLLEDWPSRSHSWCMFLRSLAPCT